MPKSNTRSSEKPETIRRPNKTNQRSKRAFWVGATKIIAVLLFEANLRGAAPVILNHSETALAGDVIYLQGGGFGPTPSVQYSYNDSNWKDLATLEAGSGVVTVKFSVAESALPDLISLRVSSDGVTWSNAVFVNRARVATTDTDEIAAGSSFRIFGRNLYFSRTPTVQLVDSVTGSHLSATVDVTASLSYDLHVIAPSGVIPGHTYMILISNGYSGNSSIPDEIIAKQSLLGRLSGVDYWNLGVPWAADLDYFSNSYNITSDPRLTLHTQGSGDTDDTAALNNAISTAATAGGGVVYLPAGSYNLYYSNGCGLNLKDRVAIKGAGAPVTTINYGFGTAPQSGTGYGVCFPNQSGLSDLTMNNVNESGMWPESGLSVGMSEVFLQRVAWNIGTSQWISLVLMNKLALENSTISQGIDSQFNYNGVLDVQGCAWCSISNNAFSFAVGGMLLNSTQNTIFEHNTVTRDVTVAPDPRSVTHFIAANFATDLNILSNTFRSIGNSFPTNNDGEVIETEGGGPVRFDEFRGTITGATENSLSDDNQNFSQSSNYIPALRKGLATVAIISGEGMGQFRTVIDISADFKTLTIDEPWDVSPEIGSHYATFDWSASGWIIAANTFTNNYKGIEIFDASARDILVQSNEMTDSSGIMISPDQQGPGLFNVTWGIDLIGNKVSDLAGVRPAYLAIVPREDQQTTSFGTAVLGIQLRGNSTIAHTPNVFVTRPDYDDSKAKVEGFNCYWQWQSPSGLDAVNAPPPLLGTIFQDNMAQNSQTAIYLNTGANETVFSDTITQQVQVTSIDEVIPGATGASTGTVIAGSLSSLSLIGSLQGDSVTVARSPTLGDLILIQPATVQASPDIGSRATPNSPFDPRTLVAKQLFGDVDVMVNIGLGPNTAASLTAFLTIRNSLAPSSAFVTVGRNATGQTVVSFRNRLGASIETFSVNFGGEWVRLVKKGSSFYALQSQDAQIWTEVGQVTSVFVSRLFYVGVATSSGVSTSQTPAVFHGFSITSIPTLTNMAARVDRPQVGLNVFSVRSLQNALLWFGEFFARGLAI